MPAPVVPAQVTQAQVVVTSGLELMAGSMPIRRKRKPNATDQTAGSKSDKISLAMGWF